MVNWTNSTNQIACWSSQWCWCKPNYSDSVVFWKSMICLFFVQCCQFHPNGNYIATGSCDRSVRLWDILSGQCVRIFTGHKVTLDNAFTHSHTHSPTHSLTHTLTHSLTHSHTHSLTHSGLNSSTCLLSWWKIPGIWKYVLNKCSILDKEMVLYHLLAFCSSFFSFFVLIFMDMQ